MLSIRIKPNHKWMDREISPKAAGNKWGYMPPQLIVGPGYREEWLRISIMCIDIGSMLGRVNVTFEFSNKS